jgi:high-affinity nickel permease
MNLVAILMLGFFLGMRHATDADHVTAVSTIVTRERTLRAAVPIGVVWGLGHTVTIVLVGGAIVLFGLVIPPKLGLGMEMSVALMLIVLGALNLRGLVDEVRAHTSPSGYAPHAHGVDSARRGWAARPLLVGVVHGMAGSAAVALLVLGTLRDSVAAIAYLMVFGLGTIVGMAVITAAMAAPMVFAARFVLIRRSLGLASGLLSVGLGAFLVYELGFEHGLLTGHPQWDPR